MKTPISIAIALCLLLSSGCGLAPLAPPASTAAPSPTATLTRTPLPTASFTPSATPSPTATPTSTSTPTTAITFTPAPTAAPACRVQNGEWGSQQTVFSFGTASRLLTFTVRDCAITSWVIWVFPLPGELLWWTGVAAIPIVENRFSHQEDTGGGGFTLAGSFDSASYSHGTLFFPAGFSVFGAILPRDVTFPWTAVPIQ